MTLHFPNASRNYSPTRHCVCFWGHDSAFEVSFHLDEEALCKISPYANRDKASRVRRQSCPNPGNCQRRLFAFAGAAELSSIVGVGFIATGPSWRKTWREVTDTAIVKPRSRKSSNRRKWRPFRRSLGFRRGRLKPPTQKRNKRNNYSTACRISGCCS
jgi:hypothetical protein